MAFDWAAFRSTADAERSRQDCIDDFYLARGPCCAGCDHWRSINAAVGQCVRFPKHVGPGIPEALGIDWTSLGPVSKALTMRDTVCGEFKDHFDWPSIGRALPPWRVPPPA